MKTLCDSLVQSFPSQSHSRSLISVASQQTQCAVIAFRFGRNVKHSYRKYDDFRSCLRLCFCIQQMQSINDTLAHINRNSVSYFNLLLFVVAVLHSISFSSFFSHHCFSSCVAVCVFPLHHYFDIQKTPHTKKKQNRIERAIEKYLNIVSEKNNLCIPAAQQFIQEMPISFYP